MSSAAPLFLDAEELRTLTGVAGKAPQIEALKQMGVPFYVNAAHRPVVVRSVLEGKPTEPKPVGWAPRLAKV